MPSYGLSIKDTASPFAGRLQTGLARKRYLAPVGQAGVKALIEHFAAKNNDASSHRSANSLGAKPQGLYAEFARATHYSILTDGVLLSVSHRAARQRYQGGDISPVNSTYLTIPAQPEAYGRRVSDFGGTLATLWGRDKSGKLRPVALYDEDAEPDADGRIPGHEIYYWLVRSVSQKADPTVLPDFDDLAASIHRDLREWFDSLEAA